MIKQASDRLIRVDSVDEEYAYVTAYLPDEGGWSILSQTLSRADSGAVDTLQLRSGDGKERAYRFDISSLSGGGHLAAPGSSSTGFLDAVMERAAEFASKNGAHHPGSLPRFPVPSDRYPGRLDVPLPILAVGEGGRGLYAPVRVVTMTFEEPEPFGVGEFPGFDSDDWPPPRLAEWPPSTIRTMDRLRLQATIGRFSAVAVRLFRTFFGRDAYSQVGDERGEYLTLLRVLDVPEMEPYYRQVAGRFFSWLEQPGS
jgi:hypothetical protein